jgi:hypothetical protein
MGYQGFTPDVFSTADKKRWKDNNDFARVIPYALIVSASRAIRNTRNKNG